MSEYHVVRDHYNEHVPPGTPDEEVIPVERCTDPVCQRYTAFMEALMTGGPSEQGSAGFGSFPEQGPNPVADFEDEQARWRQRHPLWRDTPRPLTEAEQARWRAARGDHG